jgi:hypothetical protein
MTSIVDSSLDLPKYLGFTLYGLKLHALSLHAS